MTFQVTHNKMINKRNYITPSIKSLYPNSKWWKCKKTNHNKKIRLILNDNKKKFHQNMIHNFSNHTLSNDDISLLQKGLSFVPTPTSNLNKQRQETYKETENLKQRINRTIFFNIHKQQPKFHPFKLKSSWQAPNTNHPNITNFFNNLFTNIENIQRHQIKENHNLTTKEYESLIYFQHNPEITIKKADKGGGICLLNTADYISKIYTEHLNDRSTYQQLETNPNNRICNAATTMIDYFHTHHYIDDETRRFLLPPDPVRTPVFYGLPKIHKPNNPLRPIVSGCQSPTDQLSAFVTHFIQPLATKIPSFIKDSIHFINLLKSIGPLPENIILCTADVYTQTSHMTKEYQPQHIT